jgi:hypothetical protein
VLDRYLARTGYDSQQTKERAAPDQPSNLWDPVDGAPGSDHGAHGVFDGKSHPRSAQLDVTERAQEVGSAVNDRVRGAGSAATERAKEVGSVVTERVQEARSALGRALATSGNVASETPVTETHPSEPALSEASVGEDLASESPAGPPEVWGTVPSDTAAGETPDDEGSPS